MTRTADATSLETSLWVVANSSDDATALNLTRIYDVGGARPEMVDAALRTLIRRHEALRTGFEVSTDGTLVRRALVLDAFHLFGWRRSTASTFPIRH